MLVTFIPQNVRDYIYYTGAESISFYQVAYVIGVNVDVGVWVSRIVFVCVLGCMHT